MKLSLIHEADMSRRGFLKLLGKGAAAAMAPPDIALKGLEALSKVQNPKFSVHPGRSKLSSDLDNAFWTYVDDWDYQNERAAPDVKAPVSVVGKWLYNKIINSMQSAQSEENTYAFELLTNSDRHSELKDYAEAALGKICQIKSPTFIVRKLLDHPLNRFDLTLLKKHPHLIKSNEYMWRSYFEELSDLARHSPDVKNLMLKHNLSPKFGDKPTAMRLKDFMRDSGVITPDEYEAAKAIEDFVKENKQEEQETNKPPEKTSSDAHLEREVGYERQGQLDPQSPRPAQALGPLESRLREVFKSIY